MHSFKDVLKYIPGFRSNKKWKMIAASIYYSLCLIAVTSGFGAFLLMTAIPFLVFYSITAIKQRTRKSILACIIAFAFICLGTAITPNSANTAKPVDNNSVAVNSTKVSQKSNVKKSEAEPKGKALEKKNSSSVTVSTTTPANQAVNGSLKIHYINVGQGDSILVEQNGKNMLIDTGTNASTNSLISYLQSLNISKIDYLVLTHPHEDHIGGADAVINDFNIGTIYMPKIATTTKTFEDVVNAMNSKGLKAASPALGSTFKLGSANCIVVGPANPKSNDLNTYSIVIKLTFGNTKFLFTGDAQASNEEAMITNGYDLTADVLKVGHHGSNTSSCQDFLDRVNPKYAVISVGKGNDYGHPHEGTMDKLKAKGIKVYRTDENGTIICTSDGKSISFSCNPGDYAYGRSSNSSGGGTSTSSSSGSGGSKTATVASTPKAVPVPVQAPAPAPKKSPVPAPSAIVSVSASVSNQAPVQNAAETLTVNGPSGASFTAVCHYSSKDTTYNGTVGNPLSFKIGRAKKGFTVVINITVTYNGKTYQTQTSFTPQ